VKFDRRSLQRYFLTLIVGGSGVLHFAVPGVYRRIVPDVLDHKHAVVLASGAAEIVCAVMMTIPRTRRAGGWLTAALLVAVWPANLQQALVGPRYSADGPFSSAVFPWLRLPLQVPLILLALQTATEDVDDAGTRRVSR